MFSLTSFAVIAILSQVSQVAAHGGVLSYSWSGQTYQGWSPYNTPTGQTTIQRPWSSYNPITTATDPTLSCNDDGTSGALQLTANVAAGTAITAYWNQVWPHPYGPMFTYLAQCPGSTCTGVSSDSLSWVNQSGLISGTIGNGSWGSGKMIAQNSSWTTTIPASVPSGNYLIRFETIALHSLPAVSVKQCAQITITGGGSLAPTAAQLVKFPGGYSNTDPGLTVDIYTNEALTDSNYIMPGPPLYGSAASSSAPKPTTVAPTTVAPTTAAPTTTAKTTVASTPAPSQSSTAGAAQYAQCGGQGWTGATTCVAPFKCTVSNAYVGFFLLVTSDVLLKFFANHPVQSMSLSVSLSRGDGSILPGRDSRNGYGGCAEKVAVSFVYDTFISLIQILRESQNMWRQSNRKESDKFPQNASNIIFIYSIYILMGGSVGVY
ncbi:carbohydrate-binding module family 1 protein [Sphaerobolus stellatus SS14]|nr:carbohydrate-binding module family 1 protein [Sphaerobolus stellatus SS14]